MIPEPSGKSYEKRWEALVLPTLEEGMIRVDMITIYRL